MKNEKFNDITFTIRNDDGNVVEIDGFVVFVGRRGFKRKEEGEESEVLICSAKPRMPG